MSRDLLPLAGRRVLVVEDEYFIADEMTRWLEDAGADVVGPVPSVGQALAIIESEEVLDAAVLDTNLGRGETAYPIADRLTAAGVPYLFATGDVKITRVSHYADRPRLEKPVLRHDLLAMVGRLVGTGAPSV